MGQGIENDLIKPLVNSAIVEPVNTVSQTLNRASEALTGQKLLGEVRGFEYEPAAPYSAGWFTQNMASGLGALVPYTIAGKAAGGALRGAGARLEVSGATAALLKSEKVAFMSGAFAYDGLRPVREGETRLGNAFGGAAGFYVFGVGNNLTRGFTGVGKWAGRAGTGFVGADAQATVSKLISQGQLPTFEEYMQAGVSGASMNMVLPTVQNYADRKITDLQIRSRFGAPVDKFMEQRPGSADNPELQNLLRGNEWARVRLSNHADFDARRNIFDVSKVQDTPGAIAKGLEHIREARGNTHESGFQQVSSELRTGNVEAAWEQFRKIRATQELSAHQAENRVDHAKGLTDRLLPEHMALEIGAWPAPGGVSYEYRWRQEFQQFQESNGQWRPGEQVAQTKLEPTEQRKLSPEEQTATELVQDLQKAGFLAVFAGGSVRDGVMQQLGMSAKPKDFDIATRATPDQVQQLFESKGYKVILTGKQFGVINVVAKGEQYEIATLRNDGQYSDGRRPDGVRYVNSLYEDAARRDLTINAMFSDPTTKTVFDFFGGKNDIANKLIRTVGDPAKRFEEDRLRMMRVPRFASRYEGFTVDPATAEAIGKHAREIHSVSSERIREELKGILTSKHPLTGLDFMMERGLMREVLPEVADLTGPKAMQDPVWHPEGLTWTHTRMVLNNLRGSRWETMLGGLLHDIGKPATQNILPDGRITNYGHAEVGAEKAGQIANRLKLSNAEKSLVVRLVEEHMKMHAVQEMRRSKLMDLLNNPQLDEHIALQHADAVGTARPDGISKSQRDWLQLQREQFAAQENSAQGLGAKPIIDGKVLVGMGLRSGPRIGEIKNKAIEAQREGAFSDMESAQRWLQQNFEEFRR